MKIKLDYLEITALQNVSKNPGKRVSCSSDLITYGLVAEFGEGYKITEGGKSVLNEHTPFLCCGQNMKEPLGMKMPYRKRK